MDYSKMSDQEINMAVAAIIHPESTVIESKSRPPCACITGKLPSYWVDYCNNPADALPIITANRIGIIPAPEHGLWRAANRVIGSNSDPRYFTQHANPLRAAMIVFLKMQDPANVPANPAGSDIR